MVKPILILSTLVALMSGCTSTQQSDESEEVLVLEKADGSDDFIARHCAEFYRYWALHNRASGIDARIELARSKAFHQLYQQIGHPDEIAIINEEYESKARESDIRDFGYRLKNSEFRKLIRSECGDLADRENLGIY